MMPLPIQVLLDPKGQLNLAPVPELAKMWHKHQCFLDVDLEPGEDSLLKGPEGLNLEILVEFEQGEAEKGQCEFKLLASPDSEEQTRLVYQPDQVQIVIYRIRSSLNPEVDGDEKVLTVKIEPGEGLKIHIFNDGPAVEIFVNNRTYLASRVYPFRADSNGLGLISLDKTLKIKFLDIWSLAPGKPTRTRSFPSNGQGDSFG